MFGRRPEGSSLSNSPNHLHTSRFKRYLSSLGPKPKSFMSVFRFVFSADLCDPFTWTQKRSRWPSRTIRVPYLGERLVPSEPVHMHSAGMERDALLRIRSKARDVSAERGGFGLIDPRTKFRFFLRRTQTLQLLWGVAL
jgi:hypothetical protein